MPTAMTEPNKPDIPVLLTVADVANRLSVTPRTVWRLISDGELEMVRIGLRAVRVPAASLTSYVARQAERERDLRG